MIKSKTEMSNLVVALNLLRIVTKTNSYCILNNIEDGDIRSGIELAVSEGFIKLVDGKYVPSETIDEVMKSVDADVLRSSYTRIHDVYTKMLEREVITPETYAEAACEIANETVLRGLKRDAVVHVSKAIENLKRYRVACTSIYKCVNYKVNLLLNANRLHDARNTLRNALETYSICYDRVNVETIRARVRLGILDELLGNEYSALLNYEDALSLALKLNDPNMLAYSMYTYYRLRALMCYECNDYENMLRPVNGWDLGELLKYGGVNKELIKRIRMLLAILMMGTGNYTDSYEIINNEEGEDAAFIKEVLEILMGRKDHMNDKWGNKLMKSLSSMVNSINSINCPLIPCRYKNTEIFLNTICSTIEENKNKLLSCMVPKIILLNDELRDLLFME